MKTQSRKTKAPAPKKSPTSPSPKLASIDEPISEGFRLAHWLPDVGGEAPEFVVILAPGEETADYDRDGFTLGDVLDIRGDASSLPCSRPLVDG